LFLLQQQAVDLEAPIPCAIQVNQDLDIKPSDSFTDVFNRAMSQSVLLTLKPSTKQCAHPPMRRDQRLKRATVTLQRQRVRFSVCPFDNFFTIALPMVCSPSFHVIISSEEKEEISSHAA
jgi:hypothetical protein